MIQLEEVREIFGHFAISFKPVKAEACGHGNINHTFSVETEDGSKYILQRVNTYVFKKPDELMENIRNITLFLAGKIREAGGDPERETLNLIESDNGKCYYSDPKLGDIWRIYRMIEGATAYQSAEKEGLLYEAAKAFGIFQRQLSDYPADSLHETIPDFHDTAKRYEAFERAVEENAAGRATSVQKEIDALRGYRSYASLVVDGIREGRIPVRVTHNDTKLNNIMIDDKTGKGICVIDLDTVMPGSLLYDFGDSVRFAANNGAEDDEDLSRVWLRCELYEEYVSGFLAGVGESITEEECRLLPESVLLLTYELALRFMTDYLNGDKYFKILSENHNLTRTRAQLRLVQDIEGKLPLLREITAKYTKA